MALEDDPQYRFMEAAKRALEDTRSELGLTWKLQKLAAKRDKKWVAGAYLSPVTGFDAPGYENANDKITTRTLACIVSPGEMSLTTDLHDEMKLIRRVEAIFRSATNKNAPASVRDLKVTYSSASWRYQITKIEQADRYIAQAFGVGFDASATVLATEWVIHREELDFTSLGDGNGDP